MNRIAFFAPGDPKGQPRPRAFAMKGRVRVYDPGTAEGWKSAIAIALRGSYSAPPTFTGPVSCTLRFTMPRPRAHHRGSIRTQELKPAAPMFHVGKPDADNLAKAVLDALTTLGVWKDDNQVARLMIVKHYGERTGCYIEIEEAK